MTERARINWHFTVTGVNSKQTFITIITLLERTAKLQNRLAKSLPKETTVLQPLNYLLMFYALNTEI